MIFSNVSSCTECPIFIFKRTLVYHTFFAGYRLSPCKLCFRKILFAVVTEFPPRMGNTGKSHICGDGGDSLLLEWFLR